MKKSMCAVLCSLLVCSTCYASQVKEEALQSLSTAQNFIKDGNYSKAAEELNYTLSKLNELTAEGLLNYVPDAPAGFTLVSKQSQGGAGVASIAGNAGATAEYTAENGATLNLNIAIGGMTGKMASLAALGSMFAGLNQEAGGGQTKQVRIKGYTGTLLFNSAENSGTLTFQVGNKTSVTIEASDISSDQPLLDLAGLIDMSGLEKNF